MYLCIFDFETGGLDPDLHEPIEFACLLAQPDTFAVVDQFHTRIRPTAPERLEAKALDVNRPPGMSPEEHLQLLEASPTPWDAYNALLAWVTPYWAAGRLKPVGHNVKFDLGFLRAWEKRLQISGFSDHLDYHAIDTVAIADWYLNMVRGAGTKVNLVTLTKLLGIDHEAHQALGDVRACLEVLKFMTLAVREKEQARA